MPWPSGGCSQCPPSVTPGHPAVSPLALRRPHPVPPPRVSQGVRDHRRRGHRPPREHQLPRCESPGCPRGTGMGRGGHTRSGGSQISLPGCCAKLRLSLGRRRWRRRGRCCGRSPSSSACASPSPSTSMAPVSGDGQDSVPTGPQDGDSGDTGSLPSSLYPQNRPSRFSSRPTRRASGWVCS